MSEKSELTNEAQNAEATEKNKIEIFESSKEPVMIGNDERLEVHETANIIEETEVTDEAQKAWIQIEILESNDAPENFNTSELNESVDNSEETDFTKIFQIVEATKTTESFETTEMET